MLVCLYTLRVHTSKAGRAIFIYKILSSPLSGGRSEPGPTPGQLCPVRANLLGAQECRNQGEAIRCEPGVHAVRELIMSSSDLT